MHYSKLALGLVLLLTRGDAMVGSAYFSAVSVPPPGFPGKINHWYNQVYVQVVQAEQHS